MPLFTSLTALSQTPGANPPDGGSDAPSTIDDNLRLLGSFAALLRDGAHVYVASVAGTNTITGNIASNPTSYTVGQVYRFVAAGNNTGAVTLNWNAIGAKNLLMGGVALSGGELLSTGVYEAVYDGVSFQLQTPAYKQAYQNVSGSRAAGTTYTNSTPRPIFVAIQCTGVSNSALNAALSVGGTVVSYSFIPGFASAASAATVSASVPPGATYALTLASPGSFNWLELR